MATLKVLFAAYGALAGGNKSEAHAYNVTAQLQDLIDSQGGIVQISNSSFGDPCFDNVKHFGACVIRDGDEWFFACQENQTIDFNTGGGYA
jgi:hypothetical protein